MPAGPGRKGGKPAKKKQPRKKAPSEDKQDSTAQILQSQPPPDPTLPILLTIHIMLTHHHILLINSLHLGQCL